MSPDEYQAACERTAPREWSRERRLTSFALGLGAEAAGEVLSIVRTRDERERWFLSELGDCLWYVATIATTLDVRLSVVVEQAPVEASSRSETASKLVVAVGSLQHAIRLHLDESAPLPPETTTPLLAEVVGPLASLAQIAGASLSDCFAANQNKLRRRYPP